ncbi:hypothetical protein D3C79_885340 [compost metagenome]
MIFSDASIFNASRIGERLTAKSAANLFSDNMVPLSISPEIIRILSSQDTRSPAEAFESHLEGYRNPVDSVINSPLN